MDWKLVGLSALFVAMVIASGLVATTRFRTRNRMTAMIPQTAVKTGVRTMA